MIKNLNILKLFSTSRLLFYPAMAFILFVAACSKNPSAGNDEKSWLPSGQITISKQAPQVTAPNSLSMLGFLPVLGTHTGIWLSIESKNNNVKLMDGSRVIASGTAESIDDIPPGTYQVLHMQKDALWYAPDRYFQRRSLSIPSQGARDRFRRGALGEYAIFINKDIPIHSGPVSLDEITGIRLKTQDISKIYYQLQVGSIIEVY